MGRGPGRVRMPEKPGGTLSRGTSPKGNQSGQDQQKGNSQADQAVTPSVTCGYCGKSNHTETECWRKLEKCLIYGCAEYQISNCPSASKEKRNSQQPARSAANQSSAKGSD